MVRAARAKTLGAPAQIAEEECCTAPSHAHSPGRALHDDSNVAHASCWTEQLLCPVCLPYVRCTGEVGAGVAGYVCTGRLHEAGPGLPRGEGSLGRGSDKAWPLPWRPSGHAEA